MPKNKSIDNVIAEGQQIERMWEQNPSLSLGELTHDQFGAALEDLSTKSERLEKTRNQLAADSNAVKDAAELVAALSTRVRSGVRAVFGPNSDQYEQVGGTRSSDRKRPARKSKPDGSGSSGSK